MATVQVLGVKELEAKWNEIKRELINVLPNAVKAGADIIRDAAKTNVEAKGLILTGALRRGIISEITWEKNAPVAFAGAMMDPKMNDIFVKYSKNGKRYYYPSAVEYGHGNVPAYPYMRPAFDEKKNAAKKAVRDRINAVIKGAVK